MDLINTINHTLFLKINALPDTPRWLISSNIFIAKFWICFIPLLLTVLWLWGDRNKKEIVLRALFATLIGLVLSQIIGWLWPMPRPFMIDLGHTWLAHAANYSFPSDHAVIFACIGFTFLFLDERKLAYLILLMGIAVAWARVYLGVHFPLDILGGIVVALFAYKLVAKVWSRIGENLSSYLIQIYRLVFAPLINKGWIKR